MIFTSGSHRKRRVMRFIWCVAMIPLSVLAAAGQEPVPSQQVATRQQVDLLQQELQQLKQQYDATTRDLEQRIAALQQQVEKETEANEKAKQGTISAAELAAEQAARNVVFPRGDSRGKVPGPGVSGAGI